MPIRIRRSSWLSRISAVPYVLTNVWLPTIGLALSRVRYKWSPLDFLVIAQIPAAAYPSDRGHTALAAGLGVGSLLALAISV